MPISVSHVILEGRRRGYCPWNVVGVNEKSKMFYHGRRGNHDKKFYKSRIIIFSSNLHRGVKLRMCGYLRIRIWSFELRLRYIKSVSKMADGRNLKKAWIASNSWSWKNAGFLNSCERMVCLFQLNFFIVFGGVRWEFWIRLWDWELYLTVQMQTKPS